MSSSGRPPPREPIFHEEFSPTGSVASVPNPGNPQASLRGDPVPDSPGRPGSRQSNHEDHAEAWYPASDRISDGMRSRGPNSPQHAWSRGGSEFPLPDYPARATISTASTHRGSDALNRQHGSSGGGGRCNSLSSSLQQIQQAHYGHKFGAAVLAFVRLGGQFITSVGLAFLFFELKIEYFRVPLFAEPGTRRVWDELYPPHSSGKDEDGTVDVDVDMDEGLWNNGHMQTVLWSTWGLCCLTMLYSLLVYSMFLWHCLAKGRRGWFSRWYLVADIVMFVLWCTLSALMLRFVFRPLDNKNREEQGKQWAGRMPLQYKLLSVTILCWTTTLAFVVSSGFSWQQCRARVARKWPWLTHSI